MRQQIIAMSLLFKVLSVVITEADLIADDIWKRNEELINLYNQPKPNFQKNGVRISEAKCREVIWEAKQADETVSRISEYKSKFLDFTSVVAGKDSEPGEFPHMGAVGWSAKKGRWIFLCGSFVISEWFLLTAAHCQSAPIIDVTDPSPKIVRLGVDNIVSDEKRPLDIKILKFISHPNYKAKVGKYFDIALIQLRQRIEFSKYIRPACLRSPALENGLQEIPNVTVTGWGVIEKGYYGKRRSDVLQVANVQILQSRTCDDMLWQKKNKRWSGVQDYQICATGISSNGDICSGDSGGPLQAKLQTNTTIPVYNAIGVTSFSSVCGSRKFPGVYTKIFNFIDWIEEKVWGKEVIATISPLENTVDLNLGEYLSNDKGFESNFAPIASLGWLKSQHFPRHRKFQTWSYHDTAQNVLRIE